jgi:hypothetical protein
MDKLVSNDTNPAVGGGIFSEASIAAGGRRLHSSRKILCRLAADVFVNL